MRGRNIRSYSTCGSCCRLVVVFALVLPVDEPVDEAPDMLKAERLSPVPGPLGVAFDDPRGGRRFRPRRCRARLGDWLDEDDRFELADRREFLEPAGRDLDRSASET